MRAIARWSSVALVLLLTVQSIARANDANETMLLLDDHTVARTRGVEQHFFPAQRHAANPIITRTQRWEGAGPYIWGSRLMMDESTGELRLWYIAYDFTGNFYRWGYATSRDGLAWTKPALNLETLDGKPAGNCLPLGPHPEKGTRSVARDPRPGTPPERRYLGVRFTYDGEFVSFSPDGIHWTEHPGNPVWKVPSDIIHVMWDERREQYAAYYKLWELTGTQILDDGTEKPFTAYMPTFTPTPLDGNRAAFEGPVVHFRKNAPAEVKVEKFILKQGNQGKDDGGGVSLSGAWTAKRVQAWACSDDGIHWTDEQVVLRADEHDPATANIQYLFVMQRGGYYLGFLTLHDERGAFQIQLAWSADGIQWNRGARQAWLDVGPDGAFDMGMVLGPADPIICERQMWFPYGGFPIRHDTTRQDWTSAIGLATMRLDGFAAWRAGDVPGELTTQPIRCDGDRLFVNADASHGQIRVEVLDARGHPIDGFDAAACQPLNGDTLEENGNGWVSWKAHADLKPLVGQTIQLRFVLTNTDLYALRITDQQHLHQRTPRATTH
jgi:hypothetical protein